MVFGIVVQALAECFISPRYLEYFFERRPQGRRRYVPRFQSSSFIPLFYFRIRYCGGASTKYCPDPVLFETREAGEAASVNAHYIWYYFAVIGLVAAIALFVLPKLPNSSTKKKEGIRFIYCILFVYLPSLFFKSDGFL